MKPNAEDWAAAVEKDYRLGNISRADAQRILNRAHELARLRAASEPQPCSKCGATGLHACAGSPIAPWTGDEKAALEKALQTVADSEPPAGEAVAPEGYVQALRNLCEVWRVLAHNCRFTTKSDAYIQCADEVTSALRLSVAAAPSPAVRAEPKLREGVFKENGKFWRYNYNGDQVEVRPQDAAAREPRT